MDEIHALEYLACTIDISYTELPIESHDFRSTLAILKFPTNSWSKMLKKLHRLSIPRLQGLDKFQIAWCSHPPL